MEKKTSLIHNSLLIKQNILEEASQDTEAENSQKNKSILNQRRDEQRLFVDLTD